MRTTRNGFIEDYLRETAEHIRRISHDEVERVVMRILSAYHRGARVFIAGNGGSASAASHLACDLQKTLLGKDHEIATKRLAAISLSDNVAIMTAWANDVDYERIFSEQLKNLARPGDMLICISASGNSPNIITAINTARKMGVETIAWVGFDGGKARVLADSHVWIQSHDYGIVESIHGLVAHLVTAWLAEEVRARLTAPLRMRAAS